MLAEDMLLSSFHVEVSGWDEHELFFVEKSQLAYDDPSHKCISLRRNLSDGSLVFLRLLNSSTSQSSIPMAYQAHFIGCNVQGLNQFNLQPAQPRQPTSHHSIN